MVTRRLSALFVDVVHHKPLSVLFSDVVQPIVHTQRLSVLLFASVGQSIYSSQNLSVVVVVVVLLLLPR
jgi:hypothetical protein